MLKDEFGIELRELTLNEQLAFVNFLIGENQETFERLKKLFENPEIQNENLLKSFLSTSGDLDFGENILKIAEKFEPKISNLIFEKYSEFVEVVENIEDILREEFNDVEVGVEDLKEIKENILLSAKKLLADWVRRDDVDLSDAENELAGIKANLVLIKNSFQKMRECGEACSLENIKNVILEKKNGQEILENPELLSEMEKLYLENYPDALGFSDEFRDALIDSMKQRMSLEGSEFFVIEHKSEGLVGFNSFLSIDEESISFANFNIRENVKGGKIGEALLEETLYKYARDYKIRAISLTDSKVFEYYKKLGFKVVGEEKDFQGRQVVEIELDLREKNNL
jgi:N-acetylglutamate synthase-like GNAT family acetyltransferase